MLQIECHADGMLVEHEGSQLDAEGCTLKQNAGCGVLAVLDAMALARACCSSWNGFQGYKAAGGAQMTVSSSSSDRDGLGGGCGVSADGKVTMVEVTVDGFCKSCELSSSLPSCFVLGGCWPLLWWPFCMSMDGTLIFL